MRRGWDGAAPSGLREEDVRHLVVELHHVFSNGMLEATLVAHHVFAGGRKPQSVARFIILGLYSATRHAAILGLRWDRNPTSGSVDLKEQRIYRRGTEERQTRKRRNPCPIPKRLLPHLRRWRRLTVIGPCECAGKLIQRQKTGFEAARVRAMLGDDITPHTLKHTAITWMLQKGVAIWEVAGFSSTSSKLIERRYGHHSPDHMENARNAFSRRGPKE